MVEWVVAVAVLAALLLRKESPDLVYENSFDAYGTMHGIPTDMYCREECTCIAVLLLA